MRAPRTTVGVVFVLLGSSIALGAWSEGERIAQPRSTSSVSAQTDEPDDSGWWCWDVERGGLELAVRSPNFTLAEGQALTPVGGGDSGNLRFASELDVPSDGRYRFVLESEGGHASLSVANEDGVAGQWLELKRGPVSIGVDFERDDLAVSRGRTDDGSGAGRAAARLRLLWEMEVPKLGSPIGFPLEPVPLARTHRTTPARSAADRAFLQRKGCVNCHVPEGGPKALAALATFVDQRAAPDLSDAGSRLSLAWIERWISDPNTVRAGSDMPALFSEEEADDARAVAHFVVSLRASDDAAAVEAAVATEDAVLTQGRRLFHTIGCVACHDAIASPAAVFGDDTLDDQVLEVPVVARFGDVANKWVPSELARFLLDPSAVYPDGRMPSFDLTRAEADLIATYLVSEWGAAEPKQPDAALIARGREVFGEKNCVACHALPGVDGLEPVLRELPALAMGGCLDERNENAPTYELTTPELVAVARALEELNGGASAYEDAEAGAMGMDEMGGMGDDEPTASAGSSAKRIHAPIDDALRTIADLNCLACHTMDGSGGPHEDLDVYFYTSNELVDLGDEGRLPPDLTGVGWKLTTSWLDRVLTDHGRARPYMDTRMPSYATARVANLADGLARMSGIHPGTDVAEPPVTDQDVLDGREMMSRSALGCMACHVYGDLAPSGSPGPAITQFGERLRYEWARSFLMNPQRYLPGSRMPDFGTGGRSTLERIHGGDMARQIDAMWGYFSLGEFMPVPDDVEPGTGLQLAVGDRPVVMRAFLPRAGTRGIAVGLPVGVHYAFDAREVRLVDVWKGAFLDASGSWAGRGGNELGGMGEVVWEAPEGAPFRLQLTGEPRTRDPGPPKTGEAGGFRYRGYELDADGLPTFLYDVNGVSVRERIELAALPTLTLRRTFTFDAARIARITFEASADASFVATVDGARAEVFEVEMEAGKRFSALVGSGKSMVECVLEVRP